MISAIGPRIPSITFQRLEPIRVDWTELTACLCMGADSGTSYHVFAGKEAARALGIMSTNAEDCTGDLTGLTDAQLNTLEDWKKKFAAKYPVVGTIDT